jgi:hypothetical protein
MRQRLGAVRYDATILSAMYWDFRGIFYVPNARNVLIRYSKSHQEDGRKQDISYVCCFTTGLYLGQVLQWRVLMCVPMHPECLLLSTRQFCEVHWHWCIFQTHSITLQITRREGINNNNNIRIKIKKTPWSESASKLHRPNDRRLSAKWLPTFADRGWHLVSVTDPYGRILSF